VFDSGVSSTHISLPVDESVQVSVPVELSPHSSPNTIPDAVIVPLPSVSAFAHHTALGNATTVPVA